MNKEFIKNCTPLEFFEMLRDVRGIGAINGHLLKFVKELQPDLSDDSQKFLTMLLSLQDDGNTRFSLEADSFLKKWEQKWRGLSAECETEFDFKPVIENGIADIFKNRYTAILGWNSTDKLFVIKSDSKNTHHIFATKYYKAKVAIENAAAIHFLGGKNASNSDVDKCIRRVAEIHKKDPRYSSANNPDGEFRINAEQAQAILRGQNENLIITGGPGTGKTTVVLYILWNLLESNPQYIKDWEIKLAAPSGKAADRMRESIANGLADINENFKDSPIYQKLDGLESYTIHRLLKYLPSTGKFYYGSENQFGEKTIFIIDEASMIDISLFSSMMQAIPEGARIFILGDPFQLPSVEAGAVLGEILSKKNAKRDFVVKLTTSNRFTDDSNIGKLARAVQARAEGIETGPISFDDICKETSSAKDSIYFKDLSEELVNDFVCETLEPFSDLPELAEQIIPDIVMEKAEELWNKTLSLRILCAERRGTRGVENINKMACKKIRGHWINYRQRFSPDFAAPRSQYFPGELLILTQNQNMYKLYNGDTGVVIFHEDRPFLMLKKDKFLFYPLSHLPADSIEPAFAITIHKSQGSEYRHILMFLPTNIGHPLLTNQILYTGITRAKESVTIVATSETFDAACNTVTKRETGIEL